jgi:CheY-like chemotaxis protein
MILCPGGKQGMRTVLVVDDGAFMLDFVRKILQSAKYNVVTAATANAGITAYREHKPDLVVTDVLMPEKDGLELIRELRELDPAVRIVAISGGGSTKFTNALSAAQAFGAQAAVRKPFAPNVLLEAVSRVLDGVS